VLFELPWLLEDTLPDADEAVGAVEEDAGLVVAAEVCELELVVTIELDVVALGLG
jgi:hypothetical protein